MEQQQFNTMKQFWSSRFATQGESTVGHVREDHRLQAMRIEQLLRRIFPANAYYARGLDFGSGFGRMVPFLSEFCGHVWACDIVPNVLDQAATKAPNVTPCLLEWPYRLPMRDGSMDFLLACLVLQHIVDDKFFESATSELRRVLKPGATVVLIDNAQDKAYHVKSRTPDQLGNALGLQPGWRVEKITINTRPNDHWLIHGIKVR